MVIKKSKLADYILLFFLAIALFEPLYNRSGLSGVYGSLIFVLLLALLIICIGIKNSFKYKLNIWSILAAFPIMLYGMNSSTFRYLIFFITLYFLSEYKISDLKRFHKALISIGFACCVYQLFHYSGRIYGYMYSPTIFSCCTTISVFYLLFEKNFNKRNIIYIILGMISIYWSKTSSSFIFCICITIYKIGVNIILGKKKNEDRQDLKVIKNLNLKHLIIIMAIIIAITFIVFNLNSVLSVVQRDNRDASTNTRIYYYNIFFKQLFTNFKMFLIGNGGGYTLSYIRSIVGRSGYYPLHQDFLMFICEYGILGCIYIYYFFLKNHKLNWLILLLLILCSFHNLVLTAGTTFLFFLTNSALKEQYIDEKIWR